MANRKRNKPKSFLEDKKLMTVIIWLLYILWVSFGSSIELTLINFISYVFFILAMLLLNYKDLKKHLIEFKKTPKKSILLILLFTVIAFVLTIFGKFIVMQIYGGAVDSSNEVMYETFKIVPYGTLFITFITIFYTPIVEEIVFRKSLGDVIKNKYLFVVATVLISWYFQTVIINPSMKELIIAIPTAFTSLFLAIVYTKTKNIFYCIIPKMLFNIIMSLSMITALISYLQTI